MPPATWRDLIEEGRALLPEPEYPAFEAEELLARATGKARGWFHSRRREEAPAEDAARYRALLARRAAGEPLQYLLGEWEFLGRTFRVDDRALIPRHETEEIVVAARSAAPVARRILDAGTGSGILAVSLALERADAHVTAVDVSPGALFLARRNAEALGARVAFAASDWTSALRGPAFDLVVSNPPYVPLDDLPHLQKTVSEHEPHVALFGGRDGLDAVRVLLSALPPLMAPRAPFLFEIGYAQAASVSDLVERSGAFALEEVRLDPAGIPRTVIARRR